VLVTFCLRSQENHHDSKISAISFFCSIVPNDQGLNQVNLEPFDIPKTHQVSEINVTFSLSHIQKEWEVFCYNVSDEGGDSNITKNWLRLDRIYEEIIFSFDKEYNFLMQISFTSDYGEVLTRSFNGTFKVLSKNETVIINVEHRKYNYVNNNAIYISNIGIVVKAGFICE